MWRHAVRTLDRRPVDAATVISNIGESPVPAGVSIAVGNDAPSSRDTGQRWMAHVTAPIAE